MAEVGTGVDEALLEGAPSSAPACGRGFGSAETVWLGSDFDGAFAQYVLAPASEVFTVTSGLSDAELGIVPCSFGTAENMLARAGVRRGQHVIVTGASGGVGSAAVQLARLRGAEVTAVAGAGKAAQVLDLGASRVVDRDDDPVAALGEQGADVVVDNVSGPGLDRLLAVLSAAASTSRPAPSQDRMWPSTAHVLPARPHPAGVSSSDEPSSPPWWDRSSVASYAAGRRVLPARAHRGSTDRVPREAARR